MAGELYDMLPETARIANPVTLFATYRDGWSMESLLAKTRDKDTGVIILIKAARSQYVNYSLTLLLLLMMMMMLLLLEWYWVLIVQINCHHHQQE